MKYDQSIVSDTFGDPATKYYAVENRLLLILCKSINFKWSVIAVQVPAIYPFFGERKPHFRCMVYLLDRLNG